MTPKDILLSSPRMEDKNKTDRHISARQWAGCEGDDGTSLLHNSEASLNIIVMKIQSNGNTASVIVVLSSD